MGILSDRSITRAVTQGHIVIEPFRKECLGSNSYDVHLGKELVEYEEEVLDCKKSAAHRIITIPDTGYILNKGKLYLGVTEEYTETSKKLMPILDGKSSIGRLGLFIHVTAGRGDAGYKGYWTLELVATQHIVVYPGMPIGQLSFEKIEGEVYKEYGAKKSAKYQNKTSTPIPSMMWKNWNEEKRSWIPSS
jgi:dCTP deaminase